ncbi:MAG: hypothetical protein ABR925_08645 [Acidimicrobiales bacterium]|jgi:hypothetical protein
MTLTFTVAMTGAAPGGGSFSVNYPPSPGRSCGSWFSSGGYSLPQIAETVGGQYFFMVVWLKPGQYHGPGTYSVPWTALLETVDLGSHDFNVIGGKLTMRSNGSGSLTFSHANDVLGNLDAGTVAWTCS